ncbi:hypothetical protein [Hymenobacter sp. UYCo722]|uniref:hypothetical protein n=1 Tax=Hymenobacter sp. UYCo722 TaxID=3156335 RepID=UPI0033947DD1
MDKPAQHIIRNNLIAVLVAALVLGLAAKPTAGGSAFIFGIVYLGQVAVNLLLGLGSLFSRTSDGNAAPYFLSMLLVLIIGFGACAGMLSISNFRME